MPTTTPLCLVSQLRSFIMPAKAAAKPKAAAKKAPKAKAVKKAKAAPKTKKAPKAKKAAKATKKAYSSWSGWKQDQSPTGVLQHHQAGPGL